MIVIRYEDTPEVPEGIVIVEDKTEKGEAKREEGEAR